MQLYEGTSQIQRLVIAREILMPRQVEDLEPQAAKEAAEVTEKAAEQAPAAA
jgi:acyl-CoA dehydrogenase